MRKSIRKMPAKSGVDWTAVGRRIRELRGFDMTQAEFARRVGVTQGNLSRFGRGASDIKTHVTVSSLIQGHPTVVLEFNLSSGSGKKPGGLSEHCVRRNC